MKNLFYKLLTRYKVIETIFVSWQEGDKMIKDTHDKSESERWVLAKEEDSNRIMGMVWLCRKQRVSGWLKCLIGWHKDGKYIGNKKYCLRCGKEMKRN